MNSVREVRHDPKIMCNYIKQPYLTYIFHNRNYVTALKNTTVHTTYTEGTRFGVYLGR